MARILRKAIIHFLIPTYRTFYFVTLSLTLSYLWNQTSINSYEIKSDGLYVRKSMDIDSRFVKHSLQDIKYVLLWTTKETYPFYLLGFGHESFIKSGCPVINCYVTDDRNMFGGNLSRFHAIAFNGIDLHGLKRLPQKRWAHQKYIYYNSESAHNYPICKKSWDDFFNWTATYRLDSDIRNPYVLIKDSNGLIVGPQKNMIWVDDKTSDINEDILNKVRNRTKAAAWFVSSCHVKSKRMKFFQSLQKALGKFGLIVDVYGECGKLKCSKNDHDECVKKLEREYFFYFSWENSFAEDYVTEKILTAMQHHVVPVVYGAANYSRFLPPSSYLNAIKPIKDLAKEMNDIIHERSRYLNFLRWSSHYTYHNPEKFENVCALCEALNSKMYEQHSSYKNFRRWWNPDYDRICSKMIYQLKAQLKNLLYLYKEYTRKKKCLHQSRCC